LFVREVKNERLRIISNLNTFVSLCNLLLSVKNYPCPSPPVILSVMWQGGNCFLCEMETGLTVWLAWRSRAVRQRQRKKIDRLTDTQSADLLAQNALRFTLVKIKFMIRKKQMSICYSVRRYLSIAQSDRNRDFYTTALCIVPCGNQTKSHQFNNFSTSSDSFIYQFLYRIPKILFQLYLSVYCSCISDNESCSWQRCSVRLLMPDW